MPRNILKEYHKNVLEKFSVMLSVREYYIAMFMLYKMFKKLKYRHIHVKKAKQNLKLLQEDKNSCKVIYSRTYALKNLHKNTKQKLTKNYHSPKTSKLTKIKLLSSKFSKK